MPIFEYTCQDCGHAFEDLIFGDERPQCPECESDRAEKRFSAFAVPSQASNPMPAPGACGTCGDPRGPGACAPG